MGRVIERIFDDRMVFTQQCLRPGPEQKLRKSSIAAQGRDDLLNLGI